MSVQPKKVPGPVHNLPTVQDLLRKHHEFKLAVAKGLQAIILERRCTDEEARRFARDAVLALTEDDYSESIQYGNGAVGDVYGKLLEEETWYIKVSITQSPERTNIMSCHLALYPIRTRSGTLR